MGVVNLRRPAATSSSSSPPGDRPEASSGDLAPDRAPGPPTDTWGDLARRHAPWLLQWLLRRAAPQDAEDLTQEALLALVRNREGIRAPDRIGAYLLSAARRMLRDHRARQRVEVALPPEGPSHASTTDIPDHDEREPRADVPATVAPRPAFGEPLGAAIRALPPELEQAVLAYYSRDVTYDECAELLGIPRSLLQSRLRRAKEHLRRRLAGSHSAPNPATPPENLA